MNIARDDVGYDEMASSDDIPWQVFCQNSAKFAAFEFGVQCKTYIAENPSVAEGIVLDEFGKKFVEYFIKHFEAFTLLRIISGEQSGNEDNANAFTSSKTKLVGRPNTTDLSSTFAPLETACQADRKKEQVKPNEIVKKEKSRGMFRHLSFKVLRKSAAGRTIRNLFRQSSSEDLSTIDANSDLALNLQLKGKAKGKPANVLAAQRRLDREGILNLLTTPEDFYNSPRWERCRVLLLRQDDNSILEVYAPPKVSKPKAIVMCASIVEVRQTTALEMPDNSNTFVLKAENSTELVFEAADVTDMQIWLLAIQTSMASGQQCSDTALSVSNLHLNRSNSHMSLSNDGVDGAIGGESPPQLPPRTPGRTQHMQSGLSTSSTALDQNSMEFAGDTALDRTLVEYPWFHGMLLRMEAAQLVLQQGTDGHGVFLVRQSETRLGEYVLTFNYQGRAKHLRMTLEPSGRCRVNHLWFPTVFEMLEHFRTHPIPLEAGGCADLVLTEYVICRPQTLQQQSRAQSASNINSMSSSPAAASARQSVVTLTDFVMTHGGSVRTRTQSLENLGLPLSLNSSRAVDNPYSFV